MPPRLTLSPVELSEARDPDSPSARADLANERDHRSRPAPYGRNTPRNPTSPPRSPAAIATALRDFDVSIPIKASLWMSHGSSPLFEALPAHPGNPRRNIEGESPHLWKGHTVCIPNAIVAMPT